ncbi:hypothetical protein B0H13DRAFT_2287285 [Mycena leptocephala]|nr:hypothetical protein B0H13DRAFT_2287285 [Mycena leptocephala]
MCAACCIDLAASCGGDVGNEMDVRQKVVSEFVLWRSIKKSNYCKKGVKKWLRNGIQVLQCDIKKSSPISVSSLPMSGSSKTDSSDEARDLLAAWFSFRVIDPEAPSSAVRSITCSPPDPQAVSVISTTSTIHFSTKAIQLVPSSRRPLHLKGVSRLAFLVQLGFQLGPQLGPKLAKLEIQVGELTVNDQTADFVANSRSWSSKLGPKLANLDVKSSSCVRLDIQLRFRAPTWAKIQL